MVPSDAYGGINVSVSKRKNFQNAELKRPKSSGSYSKKIKYKQWGN